MFPTKMRHAEKQESAIHTQEKKKPQQQWILRRPRMLDLTKKTVKNNYKYVQIIKGICFQRNKENIMITDRKLQ